LNRKTKQPDFEKSLLELEQLVERLESGDLPLEDALKTFERGVALTRECQGALKAAQARIDVLVKRGNDFEVQPFEGGDEDDAAAGTED
jgi:exodeoxyribonuclease VII small subunit